MWQQSEVASKGHVESKGAHEMVSFLEMEVEVVQHFVRVALANKANDVCTDVSTKESHDTAFT